MIGVDLSLAALPMALKSLDKTSKPEEACLANKVAQQTLLTTHIHQTQETHQNQIEQMDKCLDPIKTTLPGQVALRASWDAFATQNMQILSKTLKIIDLIKREQWSELFSEENQQSIKNLMSNHAYKSDALVAVPVDVSDVIYLPKKIIANHPKLIETITLIKDMYRIREEGAKVKQLSSIILKTFQLSYDPKLVDLFDIKTLVEIWDFAEKLQFQEIQQILANGLLGKMKSTFLSNECKELPYITLWEIGDTLQNKSLKVYTLALADQQKDILTAMPKSLPVQEGIRNLEKLMSYAKVCEYGEDQIQQVLLHKTFLLNDRQKTLSSTEVIALLDFFIDPSAIIFEEVFHNNYEFIWYIGMQLKLPKIQILAIKAANYAKNEKRSVNAGTFIGKVMKSHYKLWCEATKTPYQTTSCTIQ